MFEECFVPQKRLQIAPRFLYLMLQWKNGTLQAIVASKTRVRSYTSLSAVEKSRPSKGTNKSVIPHFSSPLHCRQLSCILAYLYFSKPVFCSTVLRPHPYPYTASLLFTCSRDIHHKRDRVRQSLCSSPPTPVSTSKLICISISFSSHPTPGLLLPQTRIYTDELVPT